MTPEGREEAIRAMVDELVEAGFSREDAEARVRETMLEAFDVIDVRPEDSLGHRPKSPTQRVVLPLVKARRPGSLVLDNARIYNAVSFP